MNILSIDQLDNDDIDRIIARTGHWFAVCRSGQRLTSGPLDGRTVLNLFYENSTRTLMSFTMAAVRLGAAAVTLPVERSSVKKGESLADTARTLNATRPDALIVRHPDNGAPAAIAEIVDCPVINAGDGTNEHPTQALLDAATIHHRFGRVDGLKIAICGDIRHSRVARSTGRLLKRMGAEVRLAGPPELLPEGGSHAASVDEAIAGADVVIMLRVQRERLSNELGDAPGEYLDRFGLTAERLEKAAPHAAVMHPGPMNRGIEIDSAIADNPERSLIWLQVEMGVAARMACLELVAGTSA